MVETGIKVSAIIDEAKGGSLVFVGSGPSEVQHNGLLRYNWEADGFRDDQEEVGSQRVQEFRAFCGGHEFGVGELLQVQWGESWDK